MLVVFVTIGPTNIDAKNTWPIYLKISASDLDLLKTCVFIDYNSNNSDYNTKIFAHHNPLTFGGESINFKKRKLVKSLKTFYE